MVKKSWQKSDEKREKKCGKIGEKKRIVNMFQCLNMTKLKEELKEISEMKQESEGRSK